MLRQSLKFLIIIQLFIRLRIRNLAMELQGNGMAMEWQWNLAMEWQVCLVLLFKKKLLVHKEKETRLMSKNKIEGISAFPIKRKIEHFL